MSALRSLEGLIFMAHWTCSLAVLVKQIICNHVQLNLHTTPCHPIYRVHLLLDHGMPMYLIDTPERYSFCKLHVNLECGNRAHPADVYDYYRLHRLPCNCDPIPTSATWIIINEPWSAIHAHYNSPVSMAQQQAHCGQFATNITYDLHPCRIWFAGTCFHLDVWELYLYLWTCIYLLSVTDAISNSTAARTFLISYYKHDYVNPLLCDYRFN